MMIRQTFRKKNSMKFIKRCKRSTRFHFVPFIFQRCRPFSNDVFSFSPFAGIKCPVCSKFILPDDIECHLVMCLTKPRLCYNGNFGTSVIAIRANPTNTKFLYSLCPLHPEDVLTDAKGECVICLEDLNAGDVIARLPCLCIYHKG